MGSLRGRLTVLTALSLPGTAAAEVCDKLRPGWDGTPQTLAGEAMGLFLSPAGLFLTTALLVAVLFRHAMGTALAALMWSAFISYLVLHSDPLLFAAMEEGCVAQPTLFIAASAAICLAAVIFTFRREERL
ncbi:hypothetical protein KUH32_02855 [Thalassococcus sp. CAU 1522]|uniref:DoxX family protein n=1 Tax=Thalassococcus arenae TaxID=2851652 RepID=A0ABS6N3V5_9RHOB|nr:hypothetical protein [Thalassococcus arenae]MBV2358699.1 hypothetical protein [Thalassococcus arenae]